MSDNLNPFVVVLILNYNGKTLLEEAISSYLKNTYSNYKIVLIDNGSTDNSEQFVNERFPEVEVLRLEKNKAYSGGFNAGLDHAFNKLKADHVIVTNNDVKADSLLIESLVETQSRWENVGFVTGKVYYYDHPNTLQTVGKKEDSLWWNGGHIGNREKDIGQYEEECERYFADDIYTLVTKELYQKVGGYDTLFKFQAEEFDWQARGKANGLKIIYCPKAKLWHKDSYTIGKESSFKALYNARNPFLVILKHKDKSFIRTYHKAHLKYRVFKPSFKVLLKELSLKKFLAYWKGYLSALKWKIKNKK